MPRYEDIDWSGLNSVTRQQFDELIRVDNYLWQQEIDLHGELFEELQSRMPQEMILKRELLKLSFMR
jgi:phosphoenolpyruvate carboxykinase (GTP)